MRAEGNAGERLPTGSAASRAEGDSEASAVAYWGAHAAEYDEFIVRVVPRYREQLQSLIDYSPVQALHVLELGCGSGNVSLRLAERWPDADFTFVDAAPEMLDLTRDRLRASQPAVARRAQFLPHRFEELKLAPGTVDVAVASLSLHHVADVSLVYQRIAPALVPGGRLIMLDGLRGATAREHDVHMARWSAFWHQPGHLSPDEISDMLQHIRTHDHYRSLSEHVDMLEAVGFTDVDCVWRDSVFALVTATRA